MAAPCLALLPARGWSLSASFPTGPWKIQGCKRGFLRPPSAPYKALQFEQSWTDLLGLPQPLLKFLISLYRSDISTFQADSHFCSSGYHQVGCWRCAWSSVFLQLLTMENFPKGMAGNAFSWETYFQNSSLLSINCLPFKELGRAGHFLNTVSYFISLYSLSMLAGLCCPPRLF